jgi:hypothetical protein
MTRRHSKLSIGLLAALVAALLAVVPAGVAVAGNGGDNEEDGTPGGDKDPGSDGDEETHSAPE